MNQDDLLQPNHPRFKKVYGYDPIKLAKEKQIKKTEEKEEKKAKLEEKYYNMYKVGKHSFRKADEYKTLKREVLYD